ncbi:MAG: hypothetical protein LJE70_20705 [Chromatiaceae bacterium]|nr:hypothetical protein [Chromatiaceae bacterium]
MSDAIRGKCWCCGRALTAADYGRENNCPACSKPARACRNCRHFAPGRPDDCAEPMAEPISEKERANFCELFEPTDKPAGGGAETPTKDLIRAAEDLFK